MKTRKVSIAALLVILIAVIAGLAWRANQAGGHTGPDAAGSGGDVVTNKDFQYTLPSQWAALSRQELTNEGATSGIAHTVDPPAKFTVAIEPAASSPKDMAMLQSLTLAGLQRLTGYAAVSEKSTVVNGQAAEQYLYTFSTSTKTEEQLLVVLHGGQAFSLLFTTNQKDFGTETNDFKTILASFKFL